MRPFVPFLCFLLLSPVSPIKAQHFYHIDSIRKIEIGFAQSNWDFILDTAKQGSDSYTLAQWVSIDGVIFDSVGVKYKGNSSYNPNNAKNPFHIELDHFKNQDHQGIKDIKLSNGFNEPSFIRETLLYSIIRNYMHAPQANYAQVYVNGTYMGLYTNVEAVTKTFLNNHFYTKDNSFFYADYGGCNLVYKGPDSTLYFPNYTLKSTYGWNDLVNLCNTLKNNINNIETVLDVDRALWMLALTNSMVILDSYIGQPSHNFYIYRDHNGRFNPIIWDLNGGFGVFNNPGNGPALNISQLQNLSPFLHLNDSMWPLVNKLLNVPRYKKMYIAHMRTIINEHFNNNSYVTEGLYMQSIADTAVQSDPNKFFSYTQFLSNMNNNVISGPKTIPGITLLMNTRKNFLNNTVDFQYVPPVITSVQPTNTSPNINTSVYITAQVNNANVVFLGLRHSEMDKFNRVMMFDDGLNGDGAAGDGIYGLQVPMNTVQLQYYIYAENNNAGMFSPQRAEHEFYTLDANYATISAGQLVINELMAVNNSTVQNGNGNYADWIELFNNTSSDLNLDNVFLSDNSASPFKWSFPPGTIIPANGFLIVWADEDTIPGELHCNFKLSGSGEQVQLTYPNNYVIDDITFGQQTADITFGRYPNGTGPFVTMPSTFNTFNTLTGIGDLSVNEVIRVYPNPSSGKFTLFTSCENCAVEIFNLVGEKTFGSQLTNGENEIDLNVSSGMYFIRVENGSGITYSGKLIIQ
jgi:hypothetical protein